MNTPRVWLPTVPQSSGVTYVYGTRSSADCVSRRHRVAASIPSRQYTPLRIDHPQLHELRQRRRITFLAEPQHLRCPIRHQRLAAVDVVQVLLLTVFDYVGDYVISLKRPAWPPATVVASRRRVEVTWNNRGG